MMEGRDCLTPHLTTIAAFLGVDDPIFVEAQPMQFEGPEAKAAALSTAKEKLSAIARQWPT
jgi:FMN-dependent NADH-azoreductase